MQSLQIQTPTGLHPDGIEYRIENDIVIKDPCEKCKKPVNSYSRLTLICANCAY